jgi:tetratricopeptide (TPR) repeat protein
MAAMNNQKTKASRIPELNVTNEVPPKTVIKHMARERGKLLAYIDELEEKLKRKDEAIAEFKKWQAKVADYKWHYWLSEGIKLMEEPPDKTMLNALKHLLGCHRIFDEWQKKVVNAWEQYKKAKEKFKNALEAQNKTEKKETSQDGKDTV